MKGQPHGTPHIRDDDLRSCVTKQPRYPDGKKNDETPVKLLTYYASGHCSCSGWRSARVSACAAKRGSVSKRSAGWKLIEVERSRKIERERGDQ